VLPIITIPRCDEPLHLRPKITFFFDSQCLMALSPSPAHESLLLILTADLNNILRTILIPSAIAYCQAGSNTFHQGESINGVPDLTVQVWHEGHKVGTIMLETIWVMGSSGPTFKIFLAYYSLARSYSNKSSHFTAQVRTDPSRGIFGH